MHRFLYGWAVDFSWVELLDHMITLYLTFWWTARLFSKTIAPFFLPSSSVSSQFLLSRYSPNQPAIPQLVTYRPSLKCLFPRWATFQHTFKKVSGKELGDSLHQLPLNAPESLFLSGLFLPPLLSIPSPDPARWGALPVETTVTAPSTMLPQVT